MNPPRTVRIAGALGLAALACVLALSAAAAPSRPRPGPAPDRPDEEPEEAAAPALPPVPRVESLSWRGNENLPDSQLEAVSFTRERDWRFWRPEPDFSEPTLVGDMSRVVALYRLYGFYEAKADYTLEWNEDHSRVDITVHVEEGPDVTLTRLEIDVPADLDVTPEQRSGLLDELPLVAGERFSADRYARAKDLLLERLAEAAHPSARIEGGATVDLDDHHAEVDWRVVPGPTVTFGEIRIQGLYRVDEATARREIRIESGDRYSTQVLQRTRRRLQQQGLYSWVTVQSQPAEARPADTEPPAQDAAPGDPTPSATTTGPARPGEASEAGADAEPEQDGGPAREVWPIQIRVTERPPYTIDAGVGYSSDESFRATMGWRNGNFLGDARKLRLNGLYSGILAEVGAEFTQPYFIDRDLTLVVRSSYGQQREPAYTADQVLASAGVSRPLFELWRGRISYEFTYQDVLRITPDPTIVLTLPEGESRTATIEFGLRRQSLDELLDPTEGTWFDFMVGPSLREIGSDFDFVTFVVEARHFISIPGDNVLASRLRIGAIQPVRGTQPFQIPVTSRFYNGGSNSHRGFAYHQMPPVDALNFNLGGTSLIESSIEWRFPIWRKIRGVAFVDAGLLDLRPWTYPLGELFWAVGPGLRYDTLIGPLRFDYGILLNPPDGGPVRHQWFISVGHTF